MANRCTRSARWKELYQIALLERNPAVVQNRIADAHRAILERIVELFRQPSHAEHRLLASALHYLSILKNESMDEQGAA